MNIHFNGNDLAIGEDINNLDALIDKQQFAGKKGFAVAVNENVIPRKEWDTVILKENDRVLVIKATQGG